MQPSPEAIEWGKRQAARSPRWSDTKWQQVSTIFGVILTPDQDHQDQDQDQTGQQADEHQADEQTETTARDAA